MPHPFLRLHNRQLKVFSGVAFIIHHHIISQKLFLSWVGLKNVTFYRRLRPGLASQRIKSLCFLIHGLDHDERKKEHFVFYLLCFFANAFYPSSFYIDMYSYIFVVCLGFFNIAGIVLVILWAFHPAPGLFGLFR